MTTPDPWRIRAVQRRLRRRQGAFIPKPRLPIIDEVVATLLSHHPSCANAAAAPGRAGQLAKAVHVLQAREIPG
jgi:hypothetical protein